MGGERALHFACFATLTRARVNHSALLISMLFGDAYLLCDLISAANSKPHAHTANGRTRSPTRIRRSALRARALHMIKQLSIHGLPERVFAEPEPAYRVARVRARLIRISLIRARERTSLFCSSLHFYLGAITHPSPPPPLDTVNTITASTTARVECVSLCSRRARQSVRALRVRELA